MENQSLMSWEEFALFLQQTNPDEYVPDGQVLVPMPSPGSPNGFVVWLLDMDVVKKIQRGAII